MNDVFLKIDELQFRNVNRILPYYFSIKFVWNIFFTTWEIELTTLASYVAYVCEMLFNLRNRTHDLGIICSICMWNVNHYTKLLH